MVQTVRVVVAEDDKQQARQLVATLAKLQPSWTVAATPSDLSSLLAAIETTVPHVLLMDIHMPQDMRAGKHVETEKGVLGALRQLAYQPAVILVTADPNLALEAFELSVLDYLVKPVKLPRLRQALERARDFVHSSFQQAYTEEAASGNARSKGLSWITASRGLDSVLVLPEEVVYVQAERKYTRLMLRDGEALVRVGISELETLLDERIFLRIHRSTIVNVRHIQLVRRDEFGRLRIHLSNRPEKLSISKPFESRFKAL